MKIPIVPTALVASLAGLYVVDKKYKEMEAQPLTKPEKLDKQKKIRLALMGSSVILCLAILWHTLTRRSSTPSVANRVANASSVVRSSLGMKPTKRSPISEDDFAKRVSEAAAKLRAEISKDDMMPAYPSSSYASDLAANASSSIADFISDYS